MAESYLSVDQQVAVLVRHAYVTGLQDFGDSLTKGAKLPELDTVVATVLESLGPEMVADLTILKG